MTCRSNFVVDILHFRRLPIRIATVWILLIIQQGCADHRPITSWDSPRMLAIQRKWESIYNTAMEARGQEAAEKYGKKHEKLDRLLHDTLANHLSEEDLRVLAASCGTLPKREVDRSRFANSMLDFLVVTFVKSGDREGLVKVLSSVSIEYVYPYDRIEFYLAFRAEKLKMPILILGEAYAKCQVPEVRHDIAKAVRRAFTSSGIRGEDDTEFVTNAMRWYEKEKDQLAVNVKCLTFGRLPAHKEGDPTWAPFEPQYDKMPPLFVEKASLPKQEAEQKPSQE